jgi:hypothetical protein
MFVNSRKIRKNCLVQIELNTVRYSETIINMSRMTLSR